MPRRFAPRNDKACRGRRPRRPYGAKRCHSEPVRTLAWGSASPARRGGQLARPLAHAPLRFRRGRRPRRPPRPQARNLPFLPPAGGFCQQRQKSPKTPLETAFQDFLSRVGYDFALTCPTRNRFSGFFRFKGLCLHSFPRCAVARRCPLPRWVPWCSTARVPVDIPSRRTTLSARAHTPCRAGPACPAAGMRFPTAGRCGHRPLRRDRRACRITNVGDGVLDVPRRGGRPPEQR